MKKFAQYLTKKNITIAAFVMIAIAAYFGFMPAAALAIPVFAGAVTFDATGGSGVKTLRNGDKNFLIQDTVTIPAGAVSTDIVKLLNIPAGIFVKNVYVEVVTPATATSITATIGDGAGANSWDASSNFAAAAGTLTNGVNGTDAYALTGKHYATADTIDAVVTVNTMTVGAVLKVTADCIDLS